MEWIIKRKSDGPAPRLGSNFTKEPSRHNKKCPANPNLRKEPARPFWHYIGVKKILIGYNGSDPAKWAIWDLRLAGIEEPVQAKALAVADIWMPPSDGDPTAKLSKRSREKLAEAHALAQQGAATLRELFLPWTITAEVIADSPGWGLVRKAETWDADLIVIGAHSQPVFDRYLFGSIASEVLTEAACSVRVCRGAGCKEFRVHPLRILIAVDGSDDSARAYEEVVARKWPADTEFRVVTVLDARLEDSLREGRFGESVDEHFSGMAESVSSLAVELAAKLRRAGFNAEAFVLDGNPKSEILRLAESWGAHCIFMGARGLHTDRRRKLGTVASAIARRAHCSVEVVRRRS